MREGRLPPREGGQAALEFALTLTVTLLLFFGLIDFSRAIYAASVVQWAAQYGARYGVSNPEDLTGIEAEVLAHLTGLNADEAMVTVTEPGTNLIQVNVSYDFEFIAPIVRQITGDTVTLTRQRQYGRPLASRSEARVSRVNLLFAVIVVAAVEVSVRLSSTSVVSLG